MALTEQMNSAISEFKNEIARTSIGHAVYSDQYHVCQRFRSSKEFCLAMEQLLLVHGFKFTAESWYEWAQEYDNDDEHDIDYWHDEWDRDRFNW